MIVFLNGKYCPAEEAVISLFDGGYLYGDGMFETVRLYDGHPFDLAEHLARLSDNLEALEYAFRPDTAEIRGVIEELAVRNGLSDSDARCRITISRGGGPDDPLPLDGYADIPPTLSIYVVPLPNDLVRWQRDGIAVRSMRSGFTRGSFPHLKTLNYLTTVTALRLAHASGCQEALLVDADNQVLEAATSNIFLVMDGELLTPPLELGLLAGRTRSTVLSVAESEGIPIRQTPFTISNTWGAEEAFLSGSVKEIVPIIAVDGHPVGEGTPGPVTRLLQNKYRRGVIDSLGGTLED